MSGERNDLAGGPCRRCAAVIRNTKTQNASRRLAEKSNDKTYPTVMEKRLHLKNPALQKF
jgi:hypothetical protein